MRWTGQGTDRHERRPVGDGQPDALGVRVDCGKHGEQHERLPVRGHVGLPDGRRCQADSGGVPVLRRPGRKVHYPRHLPGPEALRLLRR